MSELRSLYNIQPEQGARRMRRTRGEEEDAEEEDEGKEEAEEEEEEGGFLGRCLARTAAVPAVLH